MADFLQYLISPHEPSTFFDQHFDAKPLHVKRERPDYFDRVLSFEKIMEFLGNPANTYPNIQVVRDGQEVPFDYYTNSDVIGGRYHFNQVVDPKKLGQVFAQEKSSIRIFQAQRTFQSVAKWCRELEAIFRCPVQANIYLSPPETRGFGIHFDTHSVFALQLEGAKHWKIFDSPFPLPFNDEREAPRAFTQRVSDAKCIYEEDLTKGDLLYIPRGYLHEVSSGPQPSVHITFGVRQHSGYDLLSNAIASSREEMSLRQSLPTSIYHQDEFKAFKDNMIRLLEESLDDEFQKMTTQFGNTEPEKGADQIKKFFET